MADHGRPPRRLLLLIGTAVACAVAAFALITLLFSGDDDDPAPVARTQPAKTTGTVAKASEPTCDVRLANGKCLADAPRQKTTDAAPATAKAPRRTRPARTPSLRRAVGAKIMTGMAGTFPDQALLRRIRAGEVGGVIIMGNNVSPRLSEATAAMRRAARDGGGSGLVIATDQEGGQVKRLPQSPPSTAASAMTDPEGSGLATGQALAERGINVDLAPVTDVLAPGGFLGSRSFGSTPDKVSDGACGFAAGLGQAGVGATFKHFPGIGRATANTDSTRAAVTTSADVLRRDLRPYRSCLDSAPLVMLANASYPTLGSNEPAVLSRRIVTGLLREELGFGGVTISDTLAAPGVAGPSTAVKASRAGVDMLLYIDGATAQLAFQKVLAAVQSGALARSNVLQSAERIRALQRELART